MSDRVFVDTNVFVYLFDVDSPGKRSIARELLTELSHSAVLVVSTQVLQEFYVSVTRKLATPLPAEEAAEATRALSAYTVVQVDAPLIFRAIELCQRETVSFWDGLIIRAGVEAGCARIVSEDLQHGRSFDDTWIENPFLTSGPEI
ncbi:MAG: PIN domain-containing protein [Vicinamibacteria bacterium]